MGIEGLRRQGPELNEITVADLADMLIGWVLRWCDADANKQILEAAPWASIPEDAKWWARWELFLAAISACRFGCSEHVTEALGDAGVQDLDAEIKNRTIEACQRAGMSGVQLRRIIERLDSTHDDYTSVLLAPSVSSMEELNRHLYTKLSENVFGSIIEDAFLAFPLITFYLACAQGFEEASKQFPIIQKHGR